MPPTDQSSTSRSQQLEAMGQTINHLKEKYNEFIDEKLSLEEFWSHLLLPFLRKLSRDNKTAEMIGNYNAESANLFLINLSDKISVYRKEDDIGNESKSRELKKNIQITSSEVLRRLEDMYLSLNS